MKRFWTEVRMVAHDDGHQLLLDDRSLRTPGRRPLRLPTKALADAIAGEWRAVAGDIAPRDLPLTGIANAALDIVAPDVPRFAATLARYAQTDLTCYRAEGPQPLVARQVAAWEPPLKAVEARHGLLFRRAAGVTPVAQPEATLRAVRALVASIDPWRLAALQPVVTISGSLVLGLTLLDGAMAPEPCFDAGQLDEDWQAEQWGHDQATVAQRHARRQDFLAAARFLQLLDEG